VVKHVHAAELRIVFASVLAAAADAALVAHYLLKLSAHLASALARLRVNKLARRSSLEAGNTRGEKGGGWEGGGTQETGNAGGARACIPN
jgi:hypothetical protein